MERQDVMPRGDAIMQNPRITGIAGLSGMG